MVKISAPLPLLLCWMLLMDPEMILLGSPEPIELNMADETVDDMFNGCAEEMEKKISQKTFKQDDWKEVKKGWSGPCSEREHKTEDNLHKNHKRAICTYTSYFYATINTAVRSGKNIYGSTFKYHEFYYWLTTAIQTLKKQQQNCHTAYRRDTNEFTGERDQVFRFGSFTSSSFRTNKTNFGSKTCFKIETCLGAYLKDYPEFKESEQEVLIPPYEKFRIVDVKVGMGKLKEMEDCLTTYILKSEGAHSNVNCRLVNQ
ncbi:hypothetical protein Q5P01_003884 [Channa striata]|uniref:NAD(P)(+)--arginine ADP-ribosyltransferase n=1 Tax=Channa striata TaxID=64152 RepID=A0AA88NGQ3_CHASR|nr:hypothetical protein Q5P01_003884 [Channa striata]